MSWSGGTYTKWNSLTGGWTGDAAANIGIESGRHDSQDNDFEGGINNCLAKDGTNTPTANLNIGNYRLTNVGTAVGTADAVTLGQAQSGFNVSSTSFNFSNTQFSNDATGAALNFRKSRGATTSTNTIVQSGDVIGKITFQGANGTGYDSAAAIQAYVATTPGASGDMPGGLQFFTTSDGSATLTERMRIDQIGNLNIGVTGITSARLALYGVDTGTVNSSVLIRNSAGTDLLTIRNDGQFNTGGAANSPYNNTTASAANVFVSSSGSLQRSTSSLKYKTDVQPYTKGLAEVLALNPVFYKGKTDGNKQFAGLIAEEVDAAGLTEFVQYADDNTPDALAYGNMIALLIAAIKQLTARVEALEA